MFWLGTREGIEAKLVPQHGVEFEGLSFRGVRGKGLRTLLLGPYALLAACLAARSIIRRRMPDVVLGFGGFASFPGGLMGTAAGKPLVLHDANAVAGLATRVLAYGADRILLGFPQALRGRHAKLVEWVGNPLRDAICALPPPAQRFAERDGPLRLLVVGGSLGAQALNELVPAAIAQHRRAHARPSIVHQAGEQHIAALRDAYARHGVDGRVRRVHRRHGGALRVGGLRDLPRRRAHDLRARRGRPGRARGAAARRDRRRAERQRAVPGRRGRRAGRSRRQR